MGDWQARRKEKGFAPGSASSRGRSPVQGQLWPWGFSSQGTSSSSFRAADPIGCRCPSGQLGCMRAVGHSPQGKSSFLVQG